MKSLCLQANSGAKNKKSLMKMSRASPKGSSFDAEVPSTSKESSPALATIPSEGEVGAKNTDIVTNSVQPENFLERKKFKDQISFSSGNPFVEVVKGILHFYKEKYILSSFNLFLALLCILLSRNIKTAK